MWCMTKMVEGLIIERRSVMSLITSFVTRPPALRIAAKMASGPWKSFSGTHLVRRVRVSGLA